MIEADEVYPDALVLLPTAHKEPPILGRVIADVEASEAYAWTVMVYVPSEDIEVKVPLGFIQAIYPNPFRDYLNGQSA